jgi:pyrroloquinoline quinone biosynthesis protein A
LHGILSRLLDASNFAWYLLRANIMWTKPAATEMRFGFEVTMYVMNK